MQFTTPSQSAGMQACNASGCRNAGALHGGMGYSSALGLQTQQIPPLRQATAVGERGDDSSRCFVLTMGQWRG
jgi:hypothetical protein